MDEVVGLLRTRLRDLWSQLPYVPRALSLVWNASRRWTVAWLALLLVQGVLPLATVLLTRQVVDGMVAAVDGNGSWEVAREPLALALLLASLLVLSELLGAATRWVRTAQGELVYDHIQELIHGRTTAVDLAYYETPEYHDQMYRARVDAQGRPVALVESLGTVVQSSLTLLAMAAVLVSFGWWVPLALLVSIVPAFLVVLRFTILHHTWRIRSTPRQRMVWYLDWLLTARETAAEVRTFGLGLHFLDRFQDARGELREERLSLARREALAEMAAGGFALVLMGLILALMVMRTLGGEMSLGQLAMFYQAFFQGQRLMRTLLGRVGQIYANSLFLENLFDFLALEPSITDPVQPEPSPSGAPAISIRGLSFAYPGADRQVFEDFDLDIPSGRVVALLGANGSGKSTLIKLLCRLYDPAAGSIEFGGRDLRNLRVDELRRLVTVLFQEPARYCDTVRRNVELGDLGRAPADDDVFRALASAGAEDILDRLPLGVDSLLGKWFEGGVEISVGEWQRLALARAALRDASIVLLDEPTSAMDSWAEADWLGRFKQLVEGRTAIVITHRLTTAKNADLIYVLDRGEVVESGSHEELLALDGPYARSWKSYSPD